MLILATLNVCVGMFPLLNVVQSSRGLTLYEQRERERE